MHQKTIGPIFPYVVAILAVAGATLLRWLLDPWLGDFLPLVTLYAAVAVAVWYGGYRPALVAAALGFLVCDFLFIQPRGRFALTNVRDLVGLLAYLFTCSIIITLGEAKRAARRRTEIGQQDLAFKQRQLEMETGTRRQSEEGLRTSEQWFKALANHAPVGIFHTDAEGNCQFVNERWCEIAGLSADQARDQGWAAALHPDDRERVFREWYATAKAGREFASEYRFQTPQGRITWLSGRATVLRDESGRVSGYIGTVTDITEQKRAAEDARRNQEILKLVHTVGKVGHWEWNSLTDENKWSPEIEALYGLQPGSFEGTYQAWAKLLHPDDLPKAAEDVRRALETGKYFTEFRVIWPDGSIHWLEARANVFKDSHDKPVRIMGVNMDVTERKEMEEALRQADRRKDEFLATLAHELRNPLAPLRNAVELLRRAEDQVDLREQAHGMMDRQIGVMVRLVDDLLDISRISRGKLQLRKERVELASVVRSALEAARPSVEAQTHELTVTLPPEPVYLDADPIRLSQVFLNLLTNAAKYTEKGGHLWLTAERQGGEVVVSVRDTGVGIAAEHLPHLFVMFSQVASALERSQGGMGIGLSLVRGLVELHGGSVEARSGGPGLGSEFVVRLPVVEAPVERPQDPSGDREKVGGGPQFRILVVDDNRDAADSLAMLLRLRGHDTHTAYDGLEAVQAAATFRPEVVLLDIGLPKMNGYEAAQHIREQPWGGNMALLALTGWGQEEDKRLATEAGFDLHLTKPVDPTALEKLLSRLKTT